MTKSDIIKAIQMGDRYYNGDGVEQDYAQAMYWFTQAAEQGDSNAQFQLGYMYDNGLGVEQDIKQAIHWYIKVAERGDANAQINLAICYTHDGEEKDDRQAAAWCTKAAEQGNAVAEYFMGYYYEEGIGVEKDYAQAVHWYTQAAEQGDADARFRLAHLYFSGNGVEEDAAQAVYWYAQAAEQGMAAAQYSLAVCYEFGIGDKIDKSQAAYWYAKAAEQGYKEAQNRLEELIDEPEDEEQPSEKNSIVPVILSEPKYCEKEEICLSETPALGLKSIEECGLFIKELPSWKTEKYFKMDEILLPETEILQTGEYKVVISEKTSTSLKGKIVLGGVDYGEFSLDAENRVHCAEAVNAGPCNDLYAKLTLELVDEEERPTNAPKSGNFAWHGEIRALETYREDENHPPKTGTIIRDAGVIATEDGFISSRNPVPPWKVEWFFPMGNVLHPEVEILRTENFKIYIIEKTPVSLKGKVVYEETPSPYMEKRRKFSNWREERDYILRDDKDVFSLDAKNPEYSTGYLDIIYDVRMQMTVRLVVGG